MAQGGFSHPESFTFNPEEWTRWLRRFERYRLVSGLNKKDGEIQVNSLLYCMGDKADDIWLSFKLTAADQKDYDKVSEAFSKFFQVKKNVIYERAKFNRRVQREGESMDSFITSLHALAATCDYGDLREEFIRDRIVVGILNQKLGEEMQLKSDLTLKTATDFAREDEHVRKQQQDLKNESALKSADIEAVNARQRFQRKCPRCARSHPPRRCPAERSRCRRCNQVGHFQAVCSNTAVNEVNNYDKDDYYYSEQDLYRYPEQDNYCDDIVDPSLFVSSHADFVGSITTHQTNEEPPWFSSINLGNSWVRFKLDSGADVTIISQTVFNSLSRKPRMQTCSSRLISPGGVLRTVGQFIGRLVAGDISCQARVVVVPDECARNNLLSRDAAVRLRLIQRVNEIDYDVFAECGKLKCDPINITLRDDAEPYCVSAPRRVDFPLMPAVESELKRMQRLGIIEEVKEPTDWCAPMVVVPKKNGAVRICIDLTKLNRAVKRERFIIPTLEDMLPKLSGSSVFSTLDAVTGFNQLELNDESSKLTTFISPVGRFRFRRLCFGISSAPEIFQREMSRMLDGLSGVIVLMDDILVHAPSAEEHDRVLSKVLARIKESGLRLNKDKCVFKRSSVRYFGHVISNRGVSIDPERVKALRAMPRPNDVTELRRFIGMINFVGRYTPHLSTALHPLLQLLRNDVSWIWLHEHQNAFSRVLRMVTEAPTLAYYDYTKPIVVSADASSYGIGGALLQREGDVLRPVAFCSRTLTPAEQRYAQIEKELLGAVWACERFSRYLVGLQSFGLQTDHRPLVSIINKMDIDRAPVRCQNLLLRIRRFNPIVEYIPGNDLVLADALSRSPLPAIDAEEVQSCLETELCVESLTCALATDSGFSEDFIRSETENDEDLSAALKFTKSGWPKYYKDVPERLRQYYTERNCLSVAKGLLLHGDRVVIPTSLRGEMCRRAHEGHQGVTKCTKRALTYMWWPNLPEHIKTNVNSCSFCEKERPAQRREPLLPSIMPERPWQVLSADFCELNGKKYLIILDQFSRWIEIIPMTSTTASATIDRLKGLFARFGICERFYSDNGPPFCSFDFRQFASDLGIHLSTSSPLWPQSNGFAERAVAVAKHILRQKDVFAGLIAYRSTPHTATGVSPAKLLLGREIRTLLPTSPHVLVPDWPDFDAVRERDAAYKMQSKHFYDKRVGAKPLPDINPGDKVRMKLQGKERWSEPMTVERASVEPRSYVVYNSQGGVYRRNRNHLKPTNSVTANSDMSKSVDAPPPSDSPVQNQTQTELDNSLVAPDIVPLRRSERDRKTVCKYQAGFT